MYPASQHGFTLTELLIAVAIGALMLASVYSFYMNQRKVHTVREQVADMQQNARIGMALMVQEIRMAGYDPQGANAGIVAATANMVQFTMDITNNAGTGEPDGDIGDLNENITYRLQDADGDGDLDLVRRRTADGAFEPVAENIQSLAFMYTLADGTLTATPGDPGQVRTIQIVLTAQTRYADPALGGYRTYTLRSVTTPRNLAY
jgi:type IV pilus assembly protein PilW